MQPVAADHMGRRMGYRTEGQAMIPYTVTVDRRAEWSRCLPEWERDATRARYLDQSRRTLAGGGAAVLTPVDGRATVAATDICKQSEGE